MDSNSKATVIVVAIVVLGVVAITAAICGVSYTNREYLSEADCKLTCGVSGGVARSTRKECVCVMGKSLMTAEEK
jgi:hypothetical protein